MANTLVFDDIFLELQNELETDGHNWHINNIYVNFEKELRDKELNQIMIHSQQDQFQITSTSNKYSNKTTKDCLFFYKLPDYLLASNRSFQATFFPELRRTFNPLDFQDLQQLAILTRQISIIHQYQQLWHYFLQCGTGQIRPRERPLLSRCTIEKQLSFWPQIVTSILMSEEIIPQVEDQQNEEIDQNIYINFIQNYLDQLHKKMNLCRHQFNTIKSRIQNYSDILINKIDHFIQNQSDILTIKFHVQTKIALIKYSYSDRSYQWEFGKQKPTKLQV